MNEGGDEEEEKKTKKNKRNQFQLQDQVGTLESGSTKKKDKRIAMWELQVTHVLI